MSQVGNTFHQIINVWETKRPIKNGQKSQTKN